MHVAAVDLPDRDRLARLEVPDEYRSALQRWLAVTLDGGFVLPSKIRNLGLALAYSNKGATALAHQHGEVALADGLTRYEALEGLLAGVLARGFVMFWRNQWIIDQASDGPAP